MSRAGSDAIWAEEGAPDPRPGDPHAEIVVVCTANICRSPLAEAMLVRAAAERCGPDVPLHVSSSGVHGLTGEPAAPLSAEEARERGLDLSRHVARVTDELGVWRADLVLTMTETHRGRIVRLLPSASRWTFTIREFARLTSALKPIEDDLPLRERVRFVTRLAHGARAYVARPPGREDVSDPYGGPRAGYVEIADELEELVARIAPQLFGWRADEPR
ncbi:MAG: low molecular weight phosphatase family protein [Actinobacteria bacterium]|nr:low molecular weight phosphatase family protein [Actinomycetota bacterium]